MVISQPLFQRAVTLAVVAVLAGLLFIWAYLTTPNGLGISADSVAYLKAATSFMQTRSVAEFSSQWPPLYPMLLGIFGLIFNHDVILGARVLQGLLWAFSFVLIFFIFRAAGSLSALVCILFSGLLSLHWSVTYVQYYAWTEPLFIFFVLCNLFFLQKLFDQNLQVQRAKCLYVALLFTASLALFTRYMGLAVAGANAMAFLFLFSWPLKKRLLAAVTQSVLPLLIILPWLAHRSSFQDNNTVSAFAFQGLSLDRLADGLANIGRWFLPLGMQADEHGGSFLHQLLGFSALVIATFFLVIALRKFISKVLDKRVIDSKATNVIFSALLIVYSYVALLLFFLFFVITTMKLENRYLASFFVPFLIALILGCSLFKKAVIKWGSLLFISFSLILSYPEFRARVLLSYFNGIELNSRGTREKPLNSFMNGCPKSAQVGADHPWHFDLSFTDKVQWLPRQYYYASHKPNPNFASEVQALKERLDLVVVEDADSVLHGLINQDTSFVKIFDADGTVWVNTSRGREFCQRRDR
jgi:hypothetical protein